MSDAFTHTALVTNDLPQWPAVKRERESKVGPWTLASECTGERAAKTARGTRVDDSRGTSEKRVTECPPQLPPYGKPAHGTWPPLNEDCWYGRRAHTAKDN